MALPSRSVLRPSVKRRARQVLQDRLGLDACYQWSGAPSIRRQTFEFEVAGRTFCVAGDYRTPIYETIHEVVDYDCYQLARLPEPPSGACVIDVGANIGVTAMALHARLGLPVHSFEPMPFNIAQLRENVMSNDLESTVSIVGAAIGRRTGAAAADITWEASVSARVGTELTVAEGAPTQMVDMVSLADAIAGISDPVFLMKMDCEGAEFEIVDQITPALASRLPNLTFEVHDQNTTQNVATLTAQLQVLGYTVSPKDEMRGRRTMHHLLATRP